MVSFRFFVCYCGGGVDIDRSFVWCVVVLQMLDEDCYICVLMVVIGMQFIEYDEFEFFGIINDLGIKFILMCEQQFSYYEIGEQNVWWIVGNFMLFF